MRVESAPCVVFQNTRLLSKAVLATQLSHRGASESRARTASVLFPAALSVPGTRVAGSAHPFVG